MSCDDGGRLPKEEFEILRRSYGSILDSTYEGIIAIDSDGKVTVFNEAAGRMLGYSRTDVLGKHIRDLIPDMGLLEVVKSSNPELRQRLKVGDKVFAANRTAIIAGGRTVGAVAVFEDITAKEELLSELVDVKQFMNVMQSILDTVYAGIVFCDSSGTILFMNRIYEELLEIEKGEAIGKHITHYFPDSRLPIVLRTGRPELGWKYDFKGRTLILNRIPIKKGDQVVGAITQCIFKDISELKELVGKLNLLETKVKFYKKELISLLSAKYTLDDILGESESITKVKKLARLYARTDSPVLIVGDTGTGKELFAHAIHNCSGRSQGPFVCLNSASFPKELLESELFGYAPGAFTGAHHKGKIGKIELAEGGTLFLDEIGDLPLSAQAKLLRVIEEKRVERVGDVHPIELDFRLVAATNKDLEGMVKEGRFREDLYYRLGTMTLFVPTLRSRAQDIPLLVRHYIQEIGGKQIKISEQALNALKRYQWPGNVRELKNVIERAVSLLDQDETIDVVHLPAFTVTRSSPRGTEREVGEINLKGETRAREEEAIRKVLLSCNGKKVKAARLLGISRSVLYSKMKRYGITL